MSTQPMTYPTLDSATVYPLFDSATLEILQEIGLGTNLFFSLKPGEDIPRPALITIEETIYALMILEPLELYKVLVKEENRKKRYPLTFSGVVNGVKVKVELTRPV